LREGNFVRIPERPADVRKLWEQAASLEPTNLPDWLTPEDADDYRYVGAASGKGLASQDRERYFAELRELEETGLIIDPDPIDPKPDCHRVFVSLPRKEAIWSIGIYRGESPFELRPADGAGNPVLTSEDVTDVTATFVADPFMLSVGGLWYMFFEVMNWRSGKGEIGLATSEDGLSWNYRQIVLAEEFHLSYPYVFEWQGEYYLVPESFQAGAVRLYKARRFPTEWEFVGTLLAGPYLADASLIRHGERWWIFVESSPEQAHDTLRLFYADRLQGPWIEHARRPLIAKRPHDARPAGRLLVLEGHMVRFAQNCELHYGTDVRAFEVTELSPTTYRERRIGKVPLLGPTGGGWNAGGMHHVDVHRVSKSDWLACVDGWTEN
jgi:hypothetical protein